MIDGVAGPGEWTAARCLSIQVNVPGGTTPGAVCAMNDSANLYLLVRFARPGGDGNSAEFDFDNDGSGTVSPGDDILTLAPEAAGLLDAARFACGEAVCGAADTDLGGTSDGAAAFSNDGTFSTYEFSHPLRSGDPYDFNLRLADSIAFRLLVRLLPPGGGIIDTVLPFETILVTVPIEIGRDNVNSRADARVSVAILSSASLDAPTTIDPNSLTFGRTGDETSLVSCRPRDVNRDGIQDLVCQFSVQEAGFRPGDTAGLLRGNTLNGSPVAGVAPVVVR